MVGNKPKIWKELLDQEQPLLLPCAHDALSARLIERAGFTAYSIGGFALVGSRYGIPDIELAAYGEISSGIHDIMAATRLPVLVDGDTGYGDVKNVAHTIEGYEAMHAIRKGQIRWVAKTDSVGQREFIHTVFGIAA